MTDVTIADEVARYWDKQSAGFDARALVREGDVTFFVLTARAPS